MYSMKFTQDNVPSTHNRHTLELFVNGEDLLFIEISDGSGEDNLYTSQWITLGGDDVNKLIEELIRIRDAYELKP